jgi:hypothetical protein
LRLAGSKKCKMRKWTYSRNRNGAVVVVSAGAVIVTELV